MQIKVIVIAIVTAVLLYQGGPLTTLALRLEVNSWIYLFLDSLICSHIGEIIGSMIEETYRVTEKMDEIYEEAEKIARRLIRSNLLKKYFTLRDNH